MNRYSKIAKRVVGFLNDNWKASVGRSIESVFGRGEDVEWEYSSFLTNTSGTSNKYHYFAVVEVIDRNGNKEYVGGNAYGRIGANAKVIEIVRGKSFSMVQHMVQNKEREKERKGYEYD